MSQTRRSTTPLSSNSIFLPFFLGAILVCAVSAQRTVITIEQCLTNALANNIDLKKSGYSVAASQLQAEKSRASLQPSAQASVSLSSQISGRTDPLASNGASASASAGMTLFDGMKNIRTASRSSLNLHRERLTLDATRQKVLYDVLTHYIQAFLDSSIVRIEEENVTIQRKQLEKIEAFQASGQKPLGDLLAQKTLMAKAELQLLTARRQYDLSRLNLLQLTGDETFDTDFGLMLPQPDTSAMEIRHAFDSLLQTALTNRKEIAINLVTLKADSLQVSIEKSGYSPTISLSAGVGSRWADGGKRPFDEQFFDDNISTSVGLNISMPLYDRSATRLGIASAKVQMRLDETAQRLLRQTITLEIKKALLDFETARSQVRLTRTERESAQQAYAAAQGRYDVGAATINDLTTAATQLNSARNDYTQAIFTQFSKIITIGYYTGTIESHISTYADTWKTP